MARPPRLADAEWTVMHAVWHGSPCSARQVLQRVGPSTGWAYNTARTLLQRLVEKGALSVEMRGNVGYYRPRIDRDTARKSAVHALLQRAFDGTVGGLFQHLLRQQELSAKDRERLRQLLDDDLDDEVGLQP